MEGTGYNYVLISAVLSWVIAQIIKAIIELVRTRKFNVERLFGPGGMPSGHSAAVCSGTIAVSRQCGLSSPEFAIMCMLAMIVMYDAMSVRLEAGHHAHEINIIKKMLDIQQIQNMDIPAEEKQKKSEEELKEILGHTPLQVISGGILGIVMAFVIPMVI